MLSFSNLYHPQTDGQTEVLNRCLEMYLCLFMRDEPRYWSKFLPLAEFWYNTSFHNSLGMTPFEALYGRCPPSITGYTEGSTAIVSLVTTLTQRARVLSIIKANLLRAQHRMTQHAKSRHQDMSFVEGD
ncbi:UNVERIFIED_CONTAM: hypothetical protein Scaly_2531400 [Sesamum calycinum]|uniref:Integrase catalytic domain-containing protein n=1 Tax=Sesamum calycinum TaxID=2727403 RepID=A0AAW2LT94_9LAMI